MDKIGSGAPTPLPQKLFGRSVLLRWLGRTYWERLTKGGRWLLWPTLVMVGVTAAAPQLDVYVALSYASGIWIIGILSLLIFRPRVDISAQHADRVCAGEVLPIDIDVRQRGRFSAEQRVMAHRPPHSVAPEPDNGTPLPPLRRGERARVQLGLRCARRGVYRLGGLRVETAFPLGVLRTWRLFGGKERLLVYPQFHALSSFEIQSGRRHQPGGVALASTVGESVEYMGNRDYREGDPIRDIDWRATARLDKLVVREYREEYFVRVALILDTHVPPGAMDRRDALERAVSLCAAVGDFLARQEHLVDIFAAGPTLYHLTAGRSLAYIDQILDILACVEESPTEPFSTIEPELVENLSRLSAVVAILLDWDEPRRRFIGSLRRQGVAVKGIVMSDEAHIDTQGDADLLGAIPVIGRADFEAGIEEL